MNNHANPTGRRFPSDLIEEVIRAHDETTGELEHEPIGTEGHSVYVLIHEVLTAQDEPEIIIEGVHRTLGSANNKAMEIFLRCYSDYEPSDFYAQGTWGGIGENSVGWYISRNGTLALEIHGHVAGQVSRIYAERHEIE